MAEVLCTPFPPPDAGTDAAGEEAEGDVDEPDGDVAAGSCQEDAAEPGAEEGSDLMAQEEDAHEGGYLAQGEVFTDQAGCGRHGGVAGHAQADGKDDGREKGLGQDKEI